MMLDLVSPLKGLFKLRNLTEKAVIDNIVFRCHYRITSVILFFFCIMSTANSLIGPPIQCLYDEDDFKKLIDTYCWITTTFTLPKYHQHSLHNSVYVAHPGVAADVTNDSEKQYHKYYQWVPFMLFFQGVLFYAPHWIWKNWEGGKLRIISEGMRGAISESNDEMKQQKSRLVHYIVDSMSAHTWYTIGYIACEIFNFINVVFNIFLTDKFLGNHFLTYGIDVITDPSVAQQVFPHVTKCTFLKYGPSGSMEIKDYLCVMALNIINEKVYFFLWFWFIILATISFLALLYSIVLIFSKQARKLILQYVFKFRMSEGVSTIIEKTSFGDFLLLHLLGQNMNTRFYGRFLDEISQELSTNENDLKVPSHMKMTPEHLCLHDTQML